MAYFESDERLKKFCNCMGCEGDSKRLQFFNVQYPTRGYYIFNRQELEEWFRCISRKNRLICDYCDDLKKCYTCRRFYFIKNKLHELGYFVKISNHHYHPVESQIHQIYLLRENDFCLKQKQK